MSNPIAGIPENLEAHLKACRTLPSIPAVAVRILDLYRNEDVSIQEAARVISQDPALATKVLRASNSAFYAARYEVTTVSHAISVLGIDATLSLALSFSLLRNQRKSDSRGFDAASYWRRSAIAAVAGRRLADRIDSSTREELFLSSLLQDIGILALNEAIPSIYGPLFAESRGSHVKLIELERAKLGTDHAAVGAWLLDLWNIPEKYTRAVKATHAQKDAANSGSDLFCQATAISGNIAEIWMDPAAATCAAHDSVITLLKMSPEEFETLLAEIAAQIPEVTGEMDINVYSEEKSRQLLEQAHEALSALTMRAQQQVQQIRDLSRRDPLTSLYNRSYLEEELNREYLASSQSGCPLSLLFLDVDFFKKVNDTYGHKTGDSVLVQLAEVLKNTLRVSDFIGRYGGEEFVCLLPDTDAEQAGVVAERLRDRIASQSGVFKENEAVRITVSIGCATHAKPRLFENARKLLEEADRCLYMAKSKGRNGVVTADIG
jgi:diguanylate cyclase (GGDEF)-like protein